MQMEGYLLKQGKRTKYLVRRYFTLKDSWLSSFKTLTEPPSWQLLVVGGKVVFQEMEQGTGICLSIDGQIHYFLPESSKELKEWYSALQEAIQPRVEDIYDVGEVIEQRAFAVIKNARHKTDGTEVVLKVIKKQPNEHAMIASEKEVATEIDHPNICKTHEVFDTKTKFVLVQERLEGTSLHDKLHQEKFLVEKVAKEIMKQVLESLAYLHGRGIVHRDIKPKNIQLLNESFPFHVKLTDFGFSKKVDSIFEDTLTATVGTPYYIAPEMAKKEKYGPAVDIWACGVVLFYMLSGEMPFYGADAVQVLEQVKKAELDMSSKRWQKVSSAGQQLVRSLLQVNPNKRLMARTALQHRWFSSTGMKMDHGKTSGHPLLTQKVRPILWALWAMYVFINPTATPTPLPAKAPSALTLRLRDLNSTRRGKSMRLSRNNLLESLTSSSENGPSSEGNPAMKDNTLAGKDAKVPKQSKFLQETKETENPSQVPHPFAASIKPVKSEETPLISKDVEASRSSSHGDLNKKPSLRRHKSLVAVARTFTGFKDRQGVTIRGRK